MNLVDCAWRLVYIGSGPFSTYRPVIRLGHPEQAEDCVATRSLRTLRLAAEESVTMQTTDFTSPNSTTPGSSTPCRQLDSSRRDFLRLWAASALGVGAMGAGARAGRPLGRLVRPGEFDRPPARRLEVLDPALLTLVNRITFGYSRDTYNEAEPLGYDAFLESQLAYEGIDDSDIEARLSGYDTLTMSSQQIYDTYSMQSSVPMAQLVDSTLLRAVYSKRQLFERMVEFWSDHFNMNLQSDVLAFLKTADDRDVIRRHALGTFPELLNASARSGAMLFYLDNYANVVGHAQENYARELMELHTVGVDGGYTQQDVEEVARCLTGWTLYGFGGQLGEFIFYRDNHDVDEKTVLGVYIPALGGEIDGQTVLDSLAYHPNTARFIAHKLCVRFLGYDPPEDIVQSTTSTYLATGGDIKEMLRVILQPEVLLHLSTPKLKRPFHLMTSLLRATQADITLPRFVRDYLFTMGHTPFFWPTPDGYPDSLAAWGSGVLPRWQFVSDLLDGSIPGVSMSLHALLKSEGGTDPGMAGAAIDQILTGGSLPAAEVVKLQQLYEDVSATNPPAVADTFGVGASLPGYQWY